MPLLESSGTAGSSSGLGSFLPLILIMVVMFAVMIIPQRRRDKKVKAMLNALKPGDRVRTIGGIYGTIGAIKDDVVYLVVGPDKVRLVFNRGAISTVEDVAAENEMKEEVKEIQ
ncbi:preprotein translocase subunit YajC [Christensenellaceae bacterium OttesenSCG-928-L17]|nr:preprotein translocase subunit YajC [Christensenellaceae bacterium OttesenSCG-928-L17]